MTPTIVRAGANVLVAGSSVYGHHQGGDALRAAISNTFVVNRNVINRQLFPTSGWTPSAPKGKVTKEIAVSYILEHVLP